MSCMPSIKNQGLKSMLSSCRIVLGRKPPALWAVCGKQGSALHMQRFSQISLLAQIHPSEREKQRFRRASGARCKSYHRIPKGSAASTHRLIEPGFRPSKTCRSLNLLLRDKHRGHHGSMLSLLRSGSMRGSLASEKLAKKVVACMQAGLGCC